MSDAVRLISVCRLCGGRALEHQLEFGEVPLGNNLQQSKDDALAAATYPLGLNRCADCGHFQLGHAVDPKLLYATNYTYLSGIGATFVKHFENYADWVADACALAPGSLVVDIGSNDGTCLKAFQRRGHLVCGVDPAKLAADLANEAGVETLHRFFDGDAVAEIVRRHGRADYVTSHNVLAHVDDLAGTFRNIYELLNEGGWFGFEIGYFREVLRAGCFDTIYHEHLDYHHAAPLVAHLGRLGFEIVALETNEVQGGSLRVLARKTGGASIAAQPAAFLADERVSVLYDQPFLDQWRQRIDDQMGSLRGLLRDHADAGRRIVAYGAPTKATLLMKMAGLSGDDVAFVVEDNPYKTGRFLPGTGVPIRPSADLAATRPEVIVIFAWNFADEIIARLAPVLSGAPVEIVIPLPQLRTVGL